MILVSLSMEKNSIRRLTIMGSIDQVNRHVIIIGHHFQQQKATRVAIYLPNSIEFMAVLIGQSRRSIRGGLC